ncbi:hypothetical protein LJB90_03550 [Eubacteriales bacterium OttesenSCG-928-G02]|nr:hypothetical protein [Eubacteriales bacterium OttesenSCG-928-G02]
MALTFKALGALIVKTAAVVGTTTAIKKVVSNACEGTYSSRKKGCNNDLHKK